MLKSVLFAICLVATVFWFFESRKFGGSRGTTNNNVAPPPVAGEPIKHEEAGMAAPTTAPQHSYAGDPNTQYTGQPPMQQQQPQPTMHQVPYNPTAPQPQYQQSQSRLEPQQQAPQMSATGGPMQDQYAPGPTYSTPPPQEGTAEMPHLGHRTMDGSAAPEVHGQTPD